MSDHPPTSRYRRRRILMVAPTSFFADYGCHVRILEEVRALQARGHHVRVCTYHNGGDVPGIDIRRSVDVPWLKRAEVGSSRHKLYLDAALCITTLRQAIRFRPDVIHGHLHEGALIGALAGKFVRKPVVFDYQGSLTEEMLDHHFIRKGGLRERFVRRLEQLIDRLPDMIVPSGAAAAHYLERRGVSPQRVTVVPDGVEPERINPERLAETRTALRARLGIPPDAPVVVYLGLLATYQGTPLLLRAAREVLSQRPDVRFIIAGYPGADAYAAMAARLGISDQVIFPGRVPYDLVPALLSAGDVAVAPKLSSTESNGKLLNYMAMALPVVAFDTPVNRAICGDLGLLVPSGDIRALAHAIIAAFDCSKSHRQALRERVVKHFSWHERVRDLEAVYDRVTGTAAIPVVEHVAATSTEG